MINAQALLQRLSFNGMFSKFPDDSLVQSGLRSTVLEARTNPGVNLRLEGRRVTETTQSMEGPTHWGLRASVSLTRTHFGAWW